jgi:hypothetical protein
LEVIICARNTNARHAIEFPTPRKRFHPLLKPWPYGGSYLASNVRRSRDGLSSAMAIAVYGGAGLILAAGLIGSLKRRF